MNAKMESKGELQKLDSIMELETTMHAEDEFGDGIRKSIITNWLQFPP